MGYPGGHYLHRYESGGDPGGRRGRPRKGQAIFVGLVVGAFVLIIVHAVVFGSKTKNPKIVGRKQVAQTSSTGDSFWLYYLILGNGQRVTVNQATYQQATPGTYYDAQNPSDPVIGQSEEDNIDNGNATDQDPSVDNGGDGGGSVGGDDGGDAGGAGGDD
ncbi:MAG: hypothetical protein ACRDJU_05170 [Actinomycetota bacterium]